MTHTTLAPEFETLIDPDAPIGQLGTGFTFTKGPIWHPIDHFLLFSDMPADVRRRWDAGRGITEVRKPSNKCNGMTYNGDHNFIVCEHATSSLVRERPDGRREVLASHFDRQELNSPNDVIARSDGSMYFSDPWYGRMPVYGVEQPRPLGFQGVYRLPAGGGAPLLLVDRHLFDQPNGLCFSPDEKLPYINDTAQVLIRVYEVASDGSLSSGRVFASGIRSELEAGVPDGMKCDARGNVWVTALGGVWVYAPTGNLLGKVRVPELVTNLAWGRPDFRTLFMTSTQSLYTVRTKAGPRSEPYMRAASERDAPASGHASAPPSPSLDSSGLRVDPNRCALIIQDLQNDVISEGGAFAASGSPAHARSQRIVENVRRLAEVARARSVPVIHVWFVVNPGAPGMTLNAPLFEGVIDNKAMVRGSWGAAAVTGLEPQPGDFIVEKMRMSAWEGTQLETILKSAKRDMIINTGAWTNMSVEHTARTGADKGYFMIVPEDCCSTMNADWHHASINFALRNVAVVTTVEAVIRALGQQPDWQER
jgi:gluconolactonase